MPGSNDGGGGAGGDASDDSPVADATDIRFVGEATAAIFEAGDVDPGAIRAKRVSLTQLLDAGVNPGVAAKLRREHSLAWSFEGGEDLDRRAEQVRGLGDDERAWVAASSGGWEDGPAGDESEATADWTEATADGSGSAVAAESAWRDRSSPTPVTELDGVGEARAETLARGGINSVRSMALADPDEVAESLDLSRKRVAAWREQARRRR